MIDQLQKSMGISFCENCIFINGQINICKTGAQCIYGYVIVKRYSWFKVNISLKIFIL